ncbi:MAG: alpha/beta hydrolase family protein [Verrucomicrobiota bacterium]
MGESVPYAVYLPEAYDEGGERLPVLYLLHGGGGNELSWVDKGEIKRHADVAIGEGILSPMIFVMPAANRSRYINNYDRSVRYEDFFMEEFIPHIESVFHVVRGREGRILMGSSMGGYGSVVLAMKHPSEFLACVSFMGSFCEDDRVLAMSTAEWNESTRGSVYGRDLGKHDRFTDHYRSNDPCHLIDRAEASLLRSVAWYLDCGDDDFRLSGNMRFFQRMRSLSVPIELRVRDGGHGMGYARGGLRGSFAFIAKALKAKD